MTISPRKYAFGDFELDTAEQTLRRKGESLTLVEKPFLILCLLVEKAGRIVTKDEIFATVWANTNVEANNLTVAVANLRDVLGDDPRNPVLIETVRGRGYRFIVSVAELPQVAGDLPDLLPALSETVSGQNITDRQTIYPSVRHYAFIGACSTVLGLLFTIALLLEVSYEFDRYGRHALLLSLPVFGFVTTASFAILTWLGQRSDPHRARSVLFGTGAFTAVCILSWVILTPFLPSIAITRADGIQTQAASIAYLKNALIYFWPLSVFYVLFPFWLVVRLEIERARGRDLGDLKKGVLAYLIAGIAFWVVILVYSLTSTFFLLNRLTSDGSRVYFEQLVWLRFWLWFVLSFGSLLWTGVTALKLTGSDPPALHVGVGSKHDRRQLTVIGYVGAALVFGCLTGAVSFLRQIAPKLDRLEVVTPVLPGQRFFVRLYGQDFRPEIIYVMVVGNGCPEYKPCEVPNGAIREHSNIFEHVVENVPLTLASGEYDICVRNGDSSISNRIRLTVP